MKLLPIPNLEVYTPIFWIIGMVIIYFGLGNVISQDIWDFKGNSIEALNKAVYAILFMFVGGIFIMFGSEIWLYSKRNNSRSRFQD